MDQKASKNLTQQAKQLNKEYNGLLTCLQQMETYAGTLSSSEAKSTIYKLARQLRCDISAFNACPNPSKEDYEQFGIQFLTRLHSQDDVLYAQSKEDTRIIVENIFSGLLAFITVGIWALAVIAYKAATSTNSISFFGHNTERQEHIATIERRIRNLLGEYPASSALRICDLAKLYRINYHFRRKIICQGVTMRDYIIAAFYKFKSLSDLDLLKTQLLQAMAEREIKGTIILAPEGVNGTICGKQEPLSDFLNILQQYSEISELPYKISFDESIPFDKAKVKIKKEIVTMGVDNVSPELCTGKHVSPDDWNALISDPEVVVLDTRNDYEVYLGTFKKQSIRNTLNFRDFPQFVSENNA